MLNHLHLFLLIASVVIFITVIIITALFHRQNRSTPENMIEDPQALADAERLLQESEKDNDLVMIERFSSLKNYKESDMADITMKLVENGYDATYTPLLGPDGIGTIWKILVPVEQASAAKDLLGKLKNRHLKVIK